MGTSKKNLIKRRISFSQMARELGLPPSPTALETWKPELLGDDADDVLKAAKEASGISGELKWMVAPMVIETQERELSATSTIIDFLESAQITETLVTDLENDGSIKKPEDSVNFITIASKATVGKPFELRSSFLRLWKGLIKEKQQTDHFVLILKIKLLDWLLVKTISGVMLLLKTSPTSRE